MQGPALPHVPVESPSSRRAWIEMPRSVIERQLREVALLAEGVDRNCRVRLCPMCQWRVALLAEGVDRNTNCLVDKDALDQVALLAEGVDRNSPNGQSKT